MQKTVMIVALVMLGACSNGSNNQRDTTGMSTGAAAGQVQPGAGGSAGATGTPTGGAPATSTITPGTGTAAAADSSKRADSARAKKRP